MLAQEQAKLTARGREICRQRYEEWLTLETQLTSDTAPLDTICQAPPVCPRLRTIPGLGPLTAPAVLAAGTDATHFTAGRWPQGWGLSHASTPQGVTRVSWGSAHAAIATGVHSSGTAPAPRSAGANASAIAEGRGSGP